MYKEIVGLSKPYLNQIYQNIMIHPDILFKALGTWFLLCGFMDGIRTKAKRSKWLFIMWKVIVFFVFLGSMIMIIYVTLGNRYQVSDTKFKLELFWSYKEIIYNNNKFMLWQVAWNIIAFLPIGNALYYLVRPKKKLLKVVLICVAFSSCIELIQLFGRFGLFEFDDIFDNTIGAFLGAVFAELLYKIMRLFFHKE